MRFLDDSWYEAHLARIGESFSEPGRLSTSLVEVYRNVWGEPGHTRWIRYELENGLVREVSRGTGKEELPQASFRCFGDYASYVSVLQRRLDPKMGILGGVFKLEGGVMAAMPMLPVYDKLTACKRIEGMDC